MTMTPALSTPATRTPLRRRASALALLGVTFLIALPLVVATAFLDHVVAHDRSDLRDVALGWPLPWLQQDQTAIDPPFPHTIGVLSPWEHSTTVLTGGLLADLVLAVAAVALVLATVLVAVRRSAASAAD